MMRCMRAHLCLSVLRMRRDTGQVELERDQAYSDTLRAITSSQQRNNLRAWK